MRTLRLMASGLRPSPCAHWRREHAGRRHAHRRQARCTHRRAAPKTEARDLCLEPWMDAASSIAAFCACLSSTAIGVRWGAAVPVPASASTWNGSSAPACVQTHRSVCRWPRRAAWDLRSRALASARLRALVTRGHSRGLDRLMHPGLQIKSPAPRLLLHGKPSPSVLAIAVGSLAANFFPSPFDVL